MRTQFLFFDTKTDTEKIFVPVKIHLVLRKYINKQGLSPLYLHVTHGDRFRIPLDIYINPRHWDTKKQNLKSSVHDEDTRLIIGDVLRKVNDIKVHYRLSRIVLTPQKFVKEFNSTFSRHNFIGFCEQLLLDRKNLIKKGTYIKEKAVINKLKKFNSNLSFDDIDYNFFTKYRNHLAKLGNVKSTRNANVKIVKKYLRFAQKNGAILSIDIDDIVIGSTSGNPTFLNPEEVNLCYKYFKSEFITPSKKIALGYFLFSCFTGLRISDVLKIEREIILKGYYWLNQTKTDKGQSILLNKTAMEIIKYSKDLFKVRYSSQHIREQVKIIMKHLGINKPVNYHTSRHTFGTNFILLGGDVSRLQILLGHSEIKTTMVYVHMAEAEKNKNSDIMDLLIKQG